MPPGQLGSHIIARRCKINNPNRPFRLGFGNVYRFTKGISHFPFIFVFCFPAACVIMIMEIVADMANGILRAILNATGKELFLRDTGGMISWNI